MLARYPASDFRHESLPLVPERLRPSSPLRFPGKLAVDAEGKRLFISDSNHHRIIVCDLEGRFLDAIGSGRDSPSRATGDTSQATSMSGSAA